MCRGVFYSDPLPQPLNPFLAGISRCSNSARGWMGGGIQPKKESAWASRNGKGHRAASNGRRWGEGGFCRLLRLWRMVSRAPQKVHLELQITSKVHICLPEYIEMAIFLGNVWGRTNKCDLVGWNSSQICFEEPLAAGTCVYAKS